MERALGSQRGKDRGLAWLTENRSSKAMDVLAESGVDSTEKDRESRRLWLGKDVWLGQITHLV